MEKQEQNIRSWDDLIFENRNKAYGAYALRQGYDSHVLKGMLISIGLATAIITLSNFIDSSSVIPEIIDGTLVITPGSPPNIKTEAITPPKRTDPVRKINPAFPPVATTKPDPVEPDPQTTSTSNTEGSVNKTATTDTGTSGGVDTGTGTEAAPVKNNEPFIVVEVMPAYKGGFQGMMKTLRKNMRYPASARTMGKEGTVHVEFVVNDEGKITNVKVLRGFDLDCDKEAVRMVEKLIEWTPGFQNKIAVNVKMVLPIKFQLEQ